MSFQRLSERVQGKSRPPESRWKVVPQSRTSGRETPITEFVMCSWHKQLPHVIGIGPQWATTNVRQKATVVCEVCGSQSTKRLSICLYVSVCVSRWFVSGRRKASLASLCGDICYAVMTRRPRHGPRLASVASRSLD